MRRDDAAARDSAARQWPPIARFIRAEAALGDAALARDPYAVAAYEVLRFGLKQAWACLFGAAMLALIVATHVFYPQHAWLERYDVLFLAAVAIQILMLATKLETIDEAKVICAFHVVGTVMELHKTAIGSWIYPGASLFHIAGVRLHVRVGRQLSRPRLAAVRLPFSAPSAGGCRSSLCSPPPSI